MLRGLGGGLDASEYHSKFILERINATDKHLAHLNLAVIGLVKQEARVRDKQDGIAKMMVHYSDTEAFNLTLAQGVGELAKAMTWLADIKDLEVKRLTHKVIYELEQYEVVCKRMRDQVKEAMVARDKELNRQRRLSNSGRKMPELEADLLKATLDVNRTLKEIEELLETFEQRKLQDVKQILIDFILIQLKMHTDSINILTSVYREVCEIDETSDLQQIKKHFQRGRGEDSGRINKITRLRSQSMGALSSVFNSRKPNLTAQSSTSLNSAESTPVEEKRNVASKGDRLVQNDLVEESQEESQSSESESSASESTENTQKEREKTLPKPLEVKPVVKSGKLRRFSMNF